jgi:hypothetical protein
MIQTFDPQRLDAYEQLLARPPSFSPSSSLCISPPPPPTTRLPALIMAWLQRRHLEIDADEPLTARARTFKRARREAHLPHPVLRLLRPTGTG